MSEEQAMRRRIAAMQFAMWELHLPLGLDQRPLALGKGGKLTHVCV